MQNQITIEEILEILEKNEQTFRSRFSGGVPEAEIRGYAQAIKDIKKLINQ